MYTDRALAEMKTEQDKFFQSNKKLEEALRKVDHNAIEDAK